MAKTIKKAARPARSAAKPRASAKPKIAPARLMRRAAKPGKELQRTKQPAVDGGIGIVQTSARGFDAGKQGRRLASIPTNSMAINSQIRMYGRNLVARSRYLVLNNGYAQAAREEFVSYMVGNGIMPSPLLADADLKAQVVELWNESVDEMDADGVSNFYGMQTTIAGELFEAGECFVRIRDRLPTDGLAVPLQLQILPHEMLDTAHNETLANGGRIECGIEFSPIGARTAYWFYRANPNEVQQFNFGAGTNLTKTRVPANQVLHLFKPLRAGQIRGIPHTIAGIVTLACIDLYDDAELERKRIAALFAAFIKREKPEGATEVHPFSSDADTTQAHNTSISEFSLEPGAIIDLEEGQDVTFSAPADVGANYETFEYRNLLRAACGFGSTYAGMTGDLRQVNYGSIRAGLLALRRRIESQQHNIMVFQLCRPVWARWFSSAVLYGALPGVNVTEYAAKPRPFHKVKWIPPKWDWVDPLKDRQAEKLAVDSGFKSRSDVVEAEGYDAAEVDARIKADQDRAAAMGIKFIQLKTEIIVDPTADDEMVDDPDAGVPAPGQAAYDEIDFG